MATIRITNLKLKAIIGTNEGERENPQDVVINIKITFDATKASASDDIKDTVDYNTITQNIIREVESSSFYLIEKLAKRILDIVLSNPLVQDAQIRVDKPLALRLADSVSIELSENCRGDS